MDKLNNDGLLHLYGQGYYHDEVYIVGSRASLISLKKAIEDALETGRGSAEFFTADGEGYDLNILAREDQWESEFWTNLAFPYSEEFARDKRKNAIAPATIWYKKDGE